MTTPVRRMEDAGLVSRFRDKEDGRASRVQFTRKGQNTSIKVSDMILDFDRTLVASFSDDAQETNYENSKAYP